MKGATITLKRTGFTTTTDKHGEFILSDLQLYDSIIVTKQGYESAITELIFGRQNRVEVSLKKLDPAKP